MSKRVRKLYTAKQRAEILAVAQKENLTANDVKKKFGVTPVTYYSWRKKQGLVGKRGRRPSLLTQVSADSAIAAQVRAGVQAKVRAMMPTIIRQEVQSYLNALLTAHQQVTAPKAARAKKTL